ncbi:Signal transduction histidine kinase [Streptomyces sp. WMMB 714]|uniref:sensor histidine kinase n=1 Tax=Streptomyces sp. WMMB 714 TaxID=1286822 RepID=UPI000823A9BD|nr:histidine kinase [Streptomyces sp. WMMB 714]SCK09889.1 Signal transduction histidine kinase [Streptomyces sp. WMMB 714]
MTAAAPPARSRGLPAGYPRLLRAARGRLSPTAADALLVAVVSVPVVLLVSDGTSGRPSSLALQAGLLVPLVWRRRAPLAVFGAVAATAFVQWLAGVRLSADAALLVALYTVAAYSGPRRTVLAGAVLEAGIVLDSLSWAPEGGAAGNFVSLSAMAVAAAVIGTNVRTRRSHLASVEDRAVRLERERDQRDRLAVAGERARIAREMHDIVSHNLSVMVALADGAVFAQFRSPGTTTAAVRQISGTGRQALTDMRRFLGVLRADEPDALRHPVPGIDQLEPLVDQVRAAGLPTRLRQTGDPSPVPAAAQLTVYRLVQESLTNTLKHTPAGTRAEVRVRCSTEAVAVEIIDDGASTDRTDGARGAPPGHGIAGMRERAAVYGATLEAGPSPHGRGWQVAARLELGTAEDGAA